MITTSQFNTILNRHGETYTKHTPSSTTYDTDYGSISSQTVTETSVTVFAHPVSESDPLVVQGEVKIGDKVGYAKISDGIVVDDILEDSDSVKWKVLTKNRWRDASTDIFDKFTMRRND